MPRHLIADGYDAVCVETRQARRFPGAAATPDPEQKRDPGKWSGTEERWRHRGFRPA